MSKDNVQYLRCGSRMKTLATGEVEDFKYVNEAKRKSRELGGRTAVRVVEKFPKQ